MTWALQEGAVGGSIAANGTYTAPGNYPIIATSVYDPSKQAVVAVTVQAGGISVAVD